MNRIFIPTRLYVVLAVLCLLFALSYQWTFLFAIAQVLLLLLVLLVGYDYVRLRKLENNVGAQRHVADQLSMGDEQYITYDLTNSSAQDIKLELIDELPFQLQKREDGFQILLPSNGQQQYVYSLRPTSRGDYAFGELHLYVSTMMPSLLQLRKTLPLSKKVKVYPSFIQMKKFELQIFKRSASLQGLKKIRKIGQNDDFEHIRAYVTGDNIKSINWKATSRSNTLMINQYQDTRAQQVYCVLDKGRSMKMPFDQLSLLDYSINTALVLSNIILKKYDKVGLVTFGRQLDQVVTADDRRQHLQLIADALYEQQSTYEEPNYEKLYFYFRKYIRRRSILLLFTNFEDTYDMQRQLPYLRGLNKHHLLVVIFFINTELQEKSLMPVTTSSDIYTKTFAQKALIQKEKTAETLASQGIQVILSSPTDLSINTINKYLEIKAKRML